MGCGQSPRYETVSSATRRGDLRVCRARSTQRCPEQCSSELIVGGGVRRGSRQPRAGSSSLGYDRALEVLMSRLLILLSALLAANIAGCATPSATSDDDDSSVDDDDAPDDDDTSDDPSPLVQELDPGQNESAHPGHEPVLATFNIPPDAASTLEVFGPGDVAVEGALSREDSERTLAFTAIDGFAPETAFTVRLSWNHPDSPLEYGFQTSDAGSGLDDPLALIGRTYVLDLRDANITQPEGIGGLLESFLPDEPIVIGLGPNSRFGIGEQPGVHVHGALSGTAVAPHFQSPCEESFPLTFGPDEVLGTLDDRPADFADPEIIIGPSSLSITVQNVQMNLSNLIMEGFWTPDLADLVLSRFTAVLDTRSLSEVINPAGGDGVACELLWEAAGVECRDCVDGNPYCVDIVAEDVTLPEQPGQIFAPRGCVDIIEAFFAAGSCPETAASYDPNGGGFYELCSAWQGR